MEEDFYALSWVSLRESVWKHKKIRGVPISMTASDYFWIHMNFILFVLSLVITIVLILYEVIEKKSYSTGNWAITILRITLVGFA